MNILLVGDVHGERENIERVFKYAKDAEAEHIVQLGDLYYGFPDIDPFMNDIEREVFKTGIPFSFIKGNHDNHALLGKITDLTDVRDGVQFIPNCIPFKLGSATFLAAGGAFSVDKPDRIPGVSWWPDEQITDYDVRYSEYAEGVDIILSHDAPTTSNLDDLMSLMPFTAALKNRDRLQQIVENVKPKMLFHGHYHRRLNAVANYTVGENVTWFPSFALGFDRSRISDQCFLLNTDDVC